MLKGRTSRIMYAAFLALDISLFTQLIGFLPPDEVAGVARGRAVQPASAVVTVSAGMANTVQSIHVAGALDVEVVQQPKDDVNYVSPNNGELTQFAAVSEYGNIGLLAHNYLAGRSFSRLDVGQDVHVLYSTGDIESFVITEVLKYRALDPKSPYSSFQSLVNKDEILSVGQMFDRVYKGERHLTFQTCIAKEGLSSWGRLFVVARPKPDVASFGMGALQTKISVQP